MALKNYGILKGRPIARRLGFGASPNYFCHVVCASVDTKEIEDGMVQSVFESNC